MARASMMKRFAKWHVWLGWLVGVPVVIWTASGLFMVVKPIEEVRGEHLRIEQPEQALVLEDSTLATEGAGIKQMQVSMQGDRAIAVLTTLEGLIYRVDAVSGERLPPLSAADARDIVAQGIVGGEEVSSVTAFEPDDVPFDFRRPVAVWQVKLEDGTNIYVGQHTGKIEAVRTRWWRGFDLAWGFHIMDLRTREDTSHPILIIFAALSLIGAIMGCTLMFRRRKARRRSAVTNDG